MAIYDFRCRKCKIEFTLTDVCEEEIREAFCIDCRSEDIEIVAYSRDDEDLIANILEQLALLRKEQRRMDKEITKLSGNIKVTGYVC